MEGKRKEEEKGIAFNMAHLCFGFDGLIGWIWTLNYSYLFYGFMQKLGIQLSFYATCVILSIGPD